MYDISSRLFAAWSSHHRSWRLTRHSNAVANTRFLETPFSFACCWRSIFLMNRKMFGEFSFESALPKVHVLCYCVVLLCYAVLLCCVLLLCCYIALFCYAMLLLYWVVVWKTCVFFLVFIKSSLGYAVSISNNDHVNKCSNSRFNRQRILFVRFR